MFKDACNRKSNQKNLGTIRSSNLCVHPKTHILTRRGQRPIGKLKDEQVEVWNGFEWSNVTVRQTSIMSDLTKVSFSDGSSTVCTPEHKLYTQKRYHDKRANAVRAADLKPRDKMVKFKLPPAQEFVGDPANDCKYPYTYNGDGTPRLSLYGDKKALLPYVSVHTTSGRVTDRDLINVQLPRDIRRKFYVPMGATLDNKLKWLAGLFDGDGCVSRNGTNESLQLGSIHKEFLLRVRLMLQTLGVQSKVTQMREVGERPLPDGNGGHDMFECQTMYRIHITSCDLYVLGKLGFAPRRLTFVTREPTRNASQFVTVTSVEPDYESSPTFCFTEHKRHFGVFNGLLTGQCTEIIEYTSPDEVAECNLDSIALPKFVDAATGEFKHNQLFDVTRVVTRNLNRVIDRTF
jgi:ribonucleoside-diphosphate reductase alpha chain